MSEHNNESALFAIAEIKFMMKGFLNSPETETANEIVKALIGVLDDTSVFNSLYEDADRIIAELEDYVKKSKDPDLLFGFFELLVSMTELYVNERNDIETSLDYTEKAGKLLAPMISLADGEKELVGNICALFCMVGEKCKQLNTERALILGDKIIYEAEKRMP